MIQLSLKPAVFPAKANEAISPQWFAAYTSSCHEKRVGQHLSIRNIEFFLPVHSNISKWKNGLRALIERPLFPGYVFVKIERREKVRVLEIPGVRSIVSTGHEPIPLASEEIEKLQRAVRSLTFLPHPYLTVGHKAKIRRGPLEGMTGIVIRKKSGHRLVLSLDLIMKSVSVEVAEQDLETIDVPTAEPVPGLETKDDAANLAC